MEMASWSRASEHLVNLIGMSDQLKWNNQMTHDILYDFGIHCIFPLSQKKKRKKKFLDCNPKTIDYFAFMGMKINC